MDGRSTRHTEHLRDQTTPGVPNNSPKTRPRGSSTVPNVTRDAVNNPVVITKTDSWASGPRGILQYPWMKLSVRNARTPSNQRIRRIEFSKCYSLSWSSTVDAPNGANQAMNSLTATPARHAFPIPTTYIRLRPPTQQHHARVSLQLVSSSGYPPRPTQGIKEIDVSNY